MSNAAYQAEWCRRYKAKHGISPVTAWRRRHPVAAAKHREQEHLRSQIPAVKARHRLATQREFQRLKTAAYAAYGGFVCRCCGTTVVEFLTIDHIKRNGRQHRKEIGPGRDTLYRWLKRHGYPKGFRVLCMNCNFATRFGKRCPHSRRRA